MKIRHLFFSGLLMIVAITAASFIPSGQQQQAGDGVIRWHRTTHDFGAVLFNRTVETEFRFTNISNHPVVITRVVPSCGCTVPKFDEMPILPGREGTIKTSFKGDSRGMFNKKITVLMDVGTYELYVRGQVVDP